MSAFPKADIQNVRVGTELYGCFWPLADIESECVLCLKKRALLSLEEQSSTNEKKHETRRND